MIGIWGILLDLKEVFVAFLITFFVVYYCTVQPMCYDFDWSFDVGRWILLVLVAFNVNENERAL